MNEFIIDHPEWQTPKQKYVIGFVSLGFWMAWVYMWIPLVSLMAWIFGIQVFEHHMIELKGYQGLIDLLGIYAIVVAVLCGSLIGWATYNIRRFSGAAQRSARPVVSLEAQAKAFNVSCGDLERWQQSQMIVIEHGHIRALHSHGGVEQQGAGAVILNLSDVRAGEHDGRVKTPVFQCTAGLLRPAA
jgi:biofilm PGA synthesis protein PgaD